VSRVGSDTEASSSGLRARVGALGRQPILALFLVLALLCAGIESGLTGLLATFLIRLRSYDLIASKTGLILFLPGIAAGRVILGLVSGRARIAGLLMGLNVAAAVFGGVLFFVRLPVGATEAMLVAMGMAVSSMLLLLITMTGMLYREMSGTALGVVKLGIPIGGIVVPFIISIASRIWSFQAALAIFPLLAAAGCAALAASADMIRKRLTAATP
jgi:hypothetical protein